MNDYPSLLLVFAAGLLSFLSPCILPLIPSYLSILGTAGGKAKNQEGQEAAQKSMLLITTVCFVLGFTVVFIVLSIIMSVTFLFMGGASVYIRIAAGIIVIVLGLNVLFDFISILNYEKRFHFTKKLRGLPGAFIGGAAFGAGWTPCVGPILAGVLFLAGQSGKAGIAAFYLGVYSLGLGIPFLLAAAFFDRFLVRSAWFRARLPVIQKISGVLLIVIGFLILSDRFSALNSALQKWQYQYTETHVTEDPRTVFNDAINDSEAAGYVVSGDTEQAFHDAGLRLLNRRVKPIDFTLPLLNGGSAALSSHKGKVVILNFWATWCPPCRGEMPSMEALYQRLHSKGLEILAVDMGESQGNVQQFVEEGNFTFPVLLDEDNEAAYQYGISAIPTSFILDRDGMIVSKIVGGMNWNTPQVAAALEALLVSGAAMQE